MGRKVSCTMILVLPREIIQQFDEYLVAQNLVFEAVVIGGTALALLNIIDRQTKDCDVLCPSINDDVLAASRAFAKRLSDSGQELDDNWLNNGPESLMKVLPDGWQERLQTVFKGQALHLRSLGRRELLMSKVFALCDRGLDLADCIALSPTHSELDEISPWLMKQDGNPGWPTHAKGVVADLKRKLASGL